jgi:lipopolysaccharide transport protein LptA
MMATPSIKIADSGERATALRRARVNSVFVRIATWVLPLGAVSLLGSYALFMQHTIKVETKNQIGKIDTGTVAASFNNLAMTNPSYEGYNKKDGSRYRVSAKRAITDLSRDKPIDLEWIDGAFEQVNGRRTAVRAKKGRFNQKLGTLDLKGGINVEGPNGLRVTMNSARLDTKAGLLSSKEPVLVELPTVEVRSNSMLLDHRARNIVFNDGVSAQLRPNPKQAGGTKQSSKPTSKPDGLLGFGAGSSSPVDITAGKLAIAEKERTAQFTGRVRASQNGATLEAPTLVVAFAGGADLVGLGRQTVPTGKLKSPTSQLRQVVARDGVLLTQNGSRINARTAIFDAETRKAELIGAVKIAAPANRIIKADHAAIDTSTNTVVLTGNVIATEAQNLLRGRRLVYEPKNGLMRLSSPATKSAPGRNIFVRFRPPNQKNSKRRRPRKALAGGMSGDMAFRTNPDAPIEISARAMDVRDAKSVARFDGGVRASQGDMVLTTPVLTAHYDGQIGLFNTPGNSRRAKKSPMKLRFIRATNPVSVTSGKDVKATGQSAEFDLVANTVMISGNVVLKRGRQIVRGDKLIVDLKTGLSRMKKAGPGNNQHVSLKFGAAPKITANPGQRDCGGQMCAVFFPQEFKKQRGARKPKAPSTPVAPRRQPRQRAPKLNSGWSTLSSTN